MAETRPVAQELPERHRAGRERKLGEVPRHGLVERDEAVLDERQDERRDERLRHGRDAEELVRDGVARGADAPLAANRDAERDARNACPRELLACSLLQHGERFQGRRGHRCYPTRDRSLGRARPSFAARWDCGVVYREVDLTLTKEAKQEIIQKHGRDSADTGSTQVQVALLTTRINELTEHLRAHPKDHYSRRGLLKLVGRRRRFLNYLQRNDLEGYRALIKELGLRR